MANTTPRNDADLLNEKLAAEVEHLRIENSKSRRSDWVNPATLIALGGLVLSLLINANQYFSAKRAEDTQAAHWDIERKKLDAEIDKLKAEIARLQIEAGSVVEDRVRLQAELAKVNKDIAAWDTGIFDTNMQIKMKELELDQEVIAKREIMADALREIIANLKRTIAEMSQKKQEMIDRRTELEKQLGTVR